MPVSAHLRCRFNTNVLCVMCDGACRHAGTVRGDGVDRSAETSPKLRPEPSGQHDIFWSHIWCARSFREWMGSFESVVRSDLTPSESFTSFVEEVEPRFKRAFVSASESSWLMLVPLGKH